MATALETATRLMLWPSAAPRSRLRPWSRLTRPPERRGSSSGSSRRRNGGGGSGAGGRADVSACGSSEHAWDRPAHQAPRHGRPKVSTRGGGKRAELHLVRVRVRVQVRFQFRFRFQLWFRFRLGLSLGFGLGGGELHHSGGGSSDHDSGHAGARSERQRHAAAAHLMKVWVWVQVRVWYTKVAQCTMVMQYATQYATHNTAHYATHQLRQNHLAHAHTCRGRSGGGVAEVQERWNRGTGG